MIAFFFGTEEVVCFFAFGASFFSIRFSAAGFVRVLGVGGFKKAFFSKAPTRPKKDGVVFFFDAMRVLIYTLSPDTIFYQSKHPHAIPNSV